MPGISGVVTWNEGGAIIDSVEPASESATQHFQFCDATITVHLNGTLYRRGARGSELGVHDIAADFKQVGAACICEYEGRYAIAIIDREHGTLALAVDPMGIESLSYYRMQNRSLWFGQSLNETATFETKLKPQSIFDYFYFHTLPAPNTIFQDARKLELGERIILRSASEERLPYAQPDFSPKPVSDSDVLATLRRGIQRSTGGRRTAAAFLSGGLDSSTVVGIASEFCEVHAFTIGFNISKYDEIPFAEETAKHFGIPLTTSYVTPDDVVEAISVVATDYGEPFGNSSAIPTYFCAKRAAEAGHPLILAGDGGDELFAGNKRYQEQLIFNLYYHLPSAVRQQVIERFLGTQLGKSQLFPIRKLRRYVEQALVPMPARMQSYNYLHMFPLEEIFTFEFLRLVDEAAPDEHLRTVYGRCTSTDLIDKMLQLDWKITLADNDLRKVGQMCESAGIDVRFPMLDPEVVELSTRIGGRRKMPAFRLRGYYKHAMRDFLPPVTLKKRKHGFGLPFGPWLAQSERLRQLVEDRLRSFAQRNIMREEFLSRLSSALLGQHQGFYGEMIWLIVALESWLRVRDVYSDYRV